MSKFRNFIMKIKIRENKYHNKIKKSNNKISQFKTKKMKKKRENKK